LELEYSTKNKQEIENLRKRLEKNEQIYVNDLEKAIQKMEKQKIIFEK
jgi:hypothetical protein